MSDNDLRIENFPDRAPLFPQELKDLNRWIVRTADKQPHSPFPEDENRGPIDPHDEQYQSDYDNCMGALDETTRFAGAGFVFNYEDGLTGVDFDDCVDPETLEIRADVKEIITNINSYCEFSPSRTGIHMIVKGWQFPWDGTKAGKQGRKAGDAEIYSGKRYFTVTGHHVPGTPLIVESRDMSALYERICGGEFKRTADKTAKNQLTSADTSTPKESVQIRSTGTTLTTKRQLLMSGKIVSQNPLVISDGMGNTVQYPSHSEADLALCTVLAFGGLDSEKIDASFRQSVLFRDKWERADYRENTISSAIEAYTRSRSQVPLQVDKPQETVDWKSQFRSVGQLQAGGIRMLIDGFLPEGVNMLGALPGNCKTLLALSIAKALTTGKPFLGRFRVDSVVPVLYLIPESSGGPFRIRCEKFGIPDNPDIFLCRTVSQGGTLLLDDQAIKAAVSELKPLVILDTSIRFNKSTDENSASANKAFVDDCIALMAAGARGILGLHHATKSSRKEGLTLESALRGTGDLAAMCDSVYGLKRNDALYDNGNGPLELEVLCLKPRDFEPPMPFTIAATAKVEDKILSHIDTKSDFVALEIQDLIHDLDSRFLQVITKEPELSLAEVADLLGIKKPRVQRIAKKLRYRKAETGWRPAVTTSEDLRSAKEVPF
ncbi:MAG: phage NrS-1 polymerase family protein [Candidatus Acidiferrales bacterium]